MWLIHIIYNKACHPYFCIYLSTNLSSHVQGTNVTLVLSWRSSNVGFASVEKDTQSQIHPHLSEWLTSRTPGLMQPSVVPVHNVCSVSAYSRQQTSHASSSAARSSWSPANSTVETASCYFCPDGAQPNTHTHALHHRCRDSDVPLILVW